MAKIFEPYAKFNIRSFGIDERDVGSSSIMLLQRFNISKLVRLAKPGGTSKNKNYLKSLNVNKITFQ